MLGVSINKLGPYLEPVGVTDWTSSLFLSTMHFVEYCTMYLKSSWFLKGKLLELGLLLIFSGRPLG